MRHSRILPLFLTALLFSAAGSGLKADTKDKDKAFRKMAEKLAAVDKDLKKRTVAVYGFEMIGEKNDSYSRYATEKLTHELVETGKLLIIERSRIDKLLNEQQLSMTGVVDADTAAKIGKILSVEAVIIGSISVNGKEVELMARVIQSDTAVILKSADMTYAAESETENESSFESVQEETATAAVNAKVSLSLEKKSFRADEQITIKFTGLPGNQNDWITLVEASKSDDQYGQWFYTKGVKSGQHTFDPQQPGIYEIRVYFNWPTGSYTVQKRVRITVK